MSADTDEILTRIDGRVGFLTLNRPKAINSLTHTMVTAMDAVLAEWSKNDAVDAVIVSGAGERGLCAGGDVVAIYHSIQAGGAEARSRMVGVTSVTKVAAETRWPGATPGPETISGTWTPPSEV